MALEIPQNNWKAFFNTHMKMLKEICGSLSSAKNLNTYPITEDRFKAFELCEPSAVKIVIIGHDCYHHQGQANGLCFSVDASVKHPPSLHNILRELKSDLGESRDSGDFSDLAAQGILLLNSSLTVLEGCPGSHLKLWESFTDSVIEYISKKQKDLVFILWGNYAKSKREFIYGNHFIIEGGDPSLRTTNSGRFFGGKYFSKANNYLTMVEKTQIKWI